MVSMSEQIERLQELLTSEQIEHAQTREQLANAQGHRPLVAVESTAAIERDPSKLPWRALTTPERRQRLGI